MITCVHKSSTSHTNIPYIRILQYVHYNNCIYTGDCSWTDDAGPTAPQGTHSTRESVGFQSQSAEVSLPSALWASKASGGPSVPTPCWDLPRFACTVNHPDSSMTLRWATRNPCQLLNPCQKPYGVPLPLAPCSAGRILLRHSISISSGPGYVTTVVSKKAWFCSIYSDSCILLIMDHHGSSYYTVPTRELCPHDDNDRHFPGPPVGTRELLCAFKCGRSEHPRLVRNSPVKWCLQGTAPWNLQQNWSKRTIVSAATFQYSCVLKRATWGHLQ